MNKKLHAWIDRHPQATFTIVALVLVGTLFGLNGYHTSTPKTVIANTTKLSVATQVNDLTYATDLTSLTSNKARVSSGLLPVTVLSTDEYLKLVIDSPVILDATINPDTRITASSIRDSAGKTNIYASYFLPSQSDSLLNQYTSAKANVTVTPPSAGTSSSLSYTRYSYLQDTASSAGPTVGITGEIPIWLKILTMFTLFLSVVFFFARRSQRKALVELKKRPGGGQASIPKDRFSDIAGVDEALEELQETVMLLTNPRTFFKTGGRVSKGVLLVGPPGTGKTLLARAVAGEAGVPFFAQEGSSFMELYVGTGPKRVRELFAKARQHPDGAIIFIDEIDAIGKARRGSSNSSANDEQESTLNQILVEMDGFSQDDNIIVIAATNRVDTLDPALTRSGRFGKQVQVPLPDRVGREAILKVHSRNKPIDKDVDFAQIAKRTSGVSGADIAELVNEAALKAGREGRDTITFADFDEATAITFMGKPRKSAVVTEHDQKVTAYHEAGHVIAAMVEEHANRPVSVSIIPRGPAGGVTWMSESDDIFLTRNKALAVLTVSLAGRAGEEVFLNGEYTSGPSSDLQNATGIAIDMITKYGMTEDSLMSVSEGWLSTGAEITDSTAKAVEKLLQEALVKARRLITDNRELFQSIVDNLLIHKTLIEPQLIAIQKGAKTVDAVVKAKRKRKATTLSNPLKGSIQKVGDAIFPSNDDEDEETILKVPTFRKKRKADAHGITLDANESKNSIAK